MTEMTQMAEKHYDKVTFYWVITLLTLNAVHAALQVDLGFAIRDSWCYFRM